MTLYIYVCAWLLLLWHVYADPLSSRQAVIPKFISAPLHRRHDTYNAETDLLRRRHLRRRQTVSESLYNPPSKQGYYANSTYFSHFADLVTIGTPGQPLSLQIDTGSSDIWVEVSGSDFCQQTPNPCAPFGTYNNLSSSSYRYVNNLFLIQYGDSTAAQGDYALETIEIGSAFLLLSSELTLDAVLTNMEFALGLEANSTPVLGVGYAAGEASVVTYGQPPYPNLVDQMVSQKLIESRTYSLYLDDINASTGIILFGGVDLDKFSGTLATLPINPDSTGSIFVFYITLTGISIVTPGSSNPTQISASSTFPLSVILDSGSTLISLPSAILQPIAETMGASYSNSIQLYILPNCDSQFANGSINFVFSGVQISVLYSEFIVNPLDSEGNFFTYNDGSILCALGAMVDDSDPFGVLGDTFLRSAYVVYDLVCSPLLV
jgi:Eukaryotic aspartyl protease